MAKSVRPEELSIEIAAALAEYEDDVAEALKAECKQVAKETTQELRRTSPQKTGEYAQGWKSKTEYESREDIRIIVYNGKKPQLSHLLEFGHVCRNGTQRVFGRVPGHEHITVAETHAAEKLDARIKVRLRTV